VSGFGSQQKEEYMQNISERHDEEHFIPPGLVAYGLAHGARDSVRLREKETAIYRADLVMSMKSEVEGFNQTQNKKIQGENHYWYVQGLIILFVFYHHTGEKEKSKQAYERAKSWALDEGLIYLSTNTYSDIQEKWQELENPPKQLESWYAKVWNAVRDVCARYGEYEIQKGNGGR